MNLREKQSSVKNQGPSTSCIYYAVASLLEFLALQDGKKITFLIKDLKKLRSGYDEGGTIPSILKGMVEKGLYGFKIGGYKRIQKGFVRSEISLGNPVVTAFNKMRGRESFHTVLLTGNENNKYQYKNSYGKKWGDEGYGEDNIDNAIEFWIAYNIEKTTVNPEKEIKVEVEAKKESDNKYKAIFIVAGHEDGVFRDTGSYGFGVTERQENVGIARAIIRDLKTNLPGIEIIDISVEDSLGQYGKRKRVNQICDQKGLDYTNSLLISVHCNALNTKAYGAEGWYYHNYAEGKRFADILTRNVAEMSGLAIRCSKDEFTNRHKSLDIVHNTLPFATLFEFGFIDNAHDNAIIKVGKENFATGIRKGIIEYIRYKK